MGGGLGRGCAVGEQHVLAEAAHGGGVSLDGVEAKAIDAKRCKECGHLELFATRAPEPGTTLAR